MFQWKFIVFRANVIDFSDSPPTLTVAAPHSCHQIRRQPDDSGSGSRGWMPPTHAGSCCSLSGLRCGGCAAWQRSAEPRAATSCVGPQADPVAASKLSPYTSVAVGRSPAACAPPGPCGACASQHPHPHYHPHPHPHYHLPSHHSQHPHYHPPSHHQQPRAKTLPPQRSPSSAPASAQFIIVNAKSLVFDTKFLDLNTKFIIFTHHRRLPALIHPGDTRTTRCQAAPSFGSFTLLISIGLSRANRFLQDPVEDRLEGVKRRVLAPPVRGRLQAVVRPDLLRLRLLRQRPQQPRLPDASVPLHHNQPPTVPLHAQAICQKTLGGVCGASLQCKFAVLQISKTCR